LEQREHAISIFARSCQEKNELSRRALASCATPKARNFSTIGTLIVGVSFGLRLFLFLKQSVLDGTTTRAYNMA
jgi:hypothetical protein